MSDSGPRRRLRNPVANQSRVSALEQRLEQLASQMQSHERRVRRHGERLDRQRDRIDRLEDEATDLGVVYGRLEHQIAALEVRTAALSADREHVVATDAERSEARLLIDEVRAEHARIRARFQVVTRYEERVRRLEEALKPTPDAT